MSLDHEKENYKKLEERLNKFPQRVPPSQALYKILAHLFSEKEAGLVAKLPIKPFNVKTASRIWRVEETEAQGILNELASRAILLDIDNNGQQEYLLPPPMAGFFEFSLMRIRDDIDQKALSELFYQYLNVEEDFIKDLFLGSETRLGRVFVQESVLTNEQAIHILDYERASEIIKGSSHIGISTCYCRQKMEYINQACDAPKEVCMTFNNAAASLIKHGHARQVDAAEALDILSGCISNNLVQSGENVREGVSFICNCCGCCCEGLIAVKKFGLMQPLHTTNFFPFINQESCSACGRCVKACPIECIEMTESETGNPGQKRTPVVDLGICLGCGICVRSCNNESIFMKRRDYQIITPANSVHRTVLMAIEKGLLQNLIFDNQVLTSHRAMAAVLSAILKMPPLKQVMASKQIKSIYLDKLLSKAGPNNIKK